MIDATRKAVLYYKLAIIKGIFYSLTALGTAFMVAVMHIDFPTLPRWKKFLILLGVFISWGNTMMAFLDKTMSSIDPQPMIVTTQATVTSNPTLPPFSVTQIVPPLPPQTGAGGEQNQKQ